MGVLCCGEYDAIVVLRSGHGYRWIIFMAALAMILTLRGSKLGRLMRSELIKEMVHPMGRRENQEQQQ